MSWPVPIPSVGTQRRIVARIDALFAEIEEGEQALAEARAGVETYRKALLKAAVTGELTADWRRANNDQGQALLDGLGAKSQPRKSGRKSDKSESPGFSDMSLPRLPATWCWAKLSELIDDGPSNGYSPKASVDGSGTKALKLTATSGGKMRLDDDCVKTVGEIIELNSKLFLKPGDLVFQRGNTRELVGIAAIYDGPRSTYIYPDLMIRVRSSIPAIGEWLWRWSNSPHGRAYMMSKAQGAAGSMPKISGETLREMPVPVGPLEEIKVSLRRLAQGLAVIEDYRASIDIAEAANIRQSILASAFRGDFL